MFGFKRKALAIERRFGDLAMCFTDVAKKVARLEQAEKERTVNPDNVYAILEDLKARMPKGSAVSDHRHNELAGSVARLESKIAAMSTPHREGNLENLHSRVRALETANYEAKGRMKELENQVTCANNRLASTVAKLEDQLEMLQKATASITTEAERSKLVEAASEVERQQQAAEEMRRAGVIRDEMRDAAELRMEQANGDAPRVASAQEVYAGQQEAAAKVFANWNAPAK